ncbi:hypothetical protein EFZ10_06135 [Tatumella sp. TA1]|nr:hypothetical protein EFZ10_06135 [Tatumella sp. TA1]
MFCKLCLEEKTLRLSHSIPKAYFKRVKSNGKTVVINENGHSTDGSFDPKELMLCGDCEALLSKSYEDYGIKVLRTRGNVSKQKDHITVKNVNYKKFYLFLLSIFWRVSVSELKYYKTVGDLSKLSKSMRYSILNGTMKINETERIKIDELVKIRIYRVIDTTGFIPEDCIKGMLSNFSLNVDESNQAVIWYFVVEGFLIIYTFLIGKDIHQFRYTRLESQLTDTKVQKFFKADIKNSKLLLDLYRNLLLSFSDSKKN